VPFQRSDLVMRAVDLIFHVDCFRCAVCDRPLVPGDQFAVTPPGHRLCCRADLDHAPADVTSAPTGSSYDVTAPNDAQVDEAAATPAAVRQVDNNNENETKTSVNNFSGYYYFASAAVAVDSCHMTASSSASWNVFSPPLNFVNGHLSTMWFMVCRWPPSQEGHWARPHLCNS